jgi:hypothetical protein
VVARHNLCTNPALGVNVTGWGGGSTPTLTAVAGFGRPNAARYTAGTFMWSAAGAAFAGLSYTVSAYIRTNTFNASGSAYVEWLNSGGGVIGDTPGAAYTTTSGVVSRVSVTGTSPANTASARLVMDGVNYSVNSADITMVMVEQVGTLDTYFDGGSPGATWDGTPGNSASTLSPGQSVVLGQAAELDTALPLGRRKSRTLGQPSEVDTATAITRAKSRTLGRSVETGTALALVTAVQPTADITVNVGQPRRGWFASAPVSGWSVSPSARRWSAGKPTI